MSFKKFTLIELIVVIAILTILASIVIPNIKNIKDESKQVAMEIDEKSIQTAVDIYRTKNLNKFPTENEPTLGSPEKIDLSVLNPEYIRNISSDKYKCWIDSSGIVYVSTIDAPTNLINNSGSVSWNDVIGAKEYILYESENTVSTVSKKFSQKGKVKGNFFQGESNKEYLIKSVDFYGNDSPPVSGLYFGYGNNKPVAKIELQYEGELTDETVLQWSYSDANDINKKIENAEWRINGVETVNMPSKLISGNYKIELRVKDSFGVYSDWTEKIITVLNSNHIPVAKMRIFWKGTSLYENIVVDTSQNISGFYDSSTDPDGDAITSGIWEVNGRTSTTINSLIKSAGVYTVGLKVKDSKSAWSEYQYQTITVNPHSKSVTDISRNESGIFDPIPYSDGTYTGTLVPIGDSIQVLLSGTPANSEEVEKSSILYSSCSTSRYPAATDCSAWKNQDGYFAKEIEYTVSINGENYTGTLSRTNVSIEGIYYSNEWKWKFKSTYSGTVYKENTEIYGYEQNYSGEVYKNDF